MLDSRLLRTDPEAVARNLARRGYVLDLERFRALEERRKSMQVAADETRAARNAHAKTVGRAKAQGEDIAPLLAQGESLARKLEALEVDLASVQEDFEDLVLTLPNLLHDSVPDGRDETAVRRTLLHEHHIEVGGGLGALAGRLWRIGLMGSGATLENVARLHRALTQALRYSDRAAAHLPPQAHPGRSS